MTINFYLNKDTKSKQAEKTIFAYVRDKGKTIVLHTGERIEPKYWNAEKQQAKKNYTGSPELNTFLNSYKEEIKKLIRITKTENPFASFEDIKQAIQSRFKNETEQGFFHIYDMFMEMRKTELSQNMMKKYITLKNHLLNFQTDNNFNITFNSINLMFSDMFSNYLLNVKKHTNNTISKNFDLLRTFLKWCTDRKVNTNLEYLKFKSKTEKVDIITLTENELFNLYDLELKDKTALQQVRDVFCFACFTGQRFSDVSSLKREDIKGNFWYLRTTKTKDIIRIPLNDYAKDILKNYANQSRPLPVISSQKTNEYLKELCQIAGIDETITIIKYRGAERIEKTFKKYELVTTHTARRSFVTLSLEKGMRPETLMEITGHKDYKTFKKYIKITSNVKQSEMNKVWRKEPLKIVNL